MLDGNNEPPTMQESYASAVSAGNTRVQEHKFTHADLIPSAGMSHYRTGKALMRLVSEWNSSAVPTESEPPEVKSLARQIAQQRVRESIAAKERQAERPLHTVSEKRALMAAVTLQRSDMDLAKAMHWQLKARATDWHFKDNRDRFDGLKSLPTVRAGLVHWVQAKGWEDAERLVAGILRHYLSPKCPACGGSGVREFAGNQRRGAGKPCSACKDRKAKVMGELNVPDHGRGRALLAHMNQCTGQAAADVSQGAHRLRRDDKNEVDRSNHKFHEKIEELRRADAEAKADEKQDAAAVAEHFRVSMDKPRRGGRDA